MRSTLASFQWDVDVVDAHPSRVDGVVAIVLVQGEVAQALTVSEALVRCFSLDRAKWFTTAHYFRQFLLELNFTILVTVYVWFCLFTLLWTNKW